MTARDMFYSKNKKFSSAEEKAFAREELIFNVTEDLLVIMEDKGISKAELSRRLGKSKAYISQILSGGRNMTLGSLSDICFVMGFKPKVELFVEKIDSCKRVDSTNFAMFSVIDGGKLAESVKPSTNTTTTTTLKATG